MIEYKELTALPYKKSIKVPLRNSNNKKWKQPYQAAYTAALHTTKRGVETLVICLYKRKRNCDSNTGWTIAERIFLNSLGDIAVEGYGEITKTFYRGNFRIGNYGEIGFEYYWSLSSKLISGCTSPALYSPNEDIASSFINRHNVLKEYKPERKVENTLEWIVNLQYHKECEAEERRAINREIKAKALMATIPDAPKAFEEWIFTKELILAPWFYSFNHKRIQNGICGNCNKKSSLEGIKDHKRINCPHCGAQLQCTNISSLNYFGHYSISNEFRIIQRRCDNEYVTRKFHAELSFIYFDGEEEIRQKRYLRERRRDFWKISQNSPNPHTPNVTELYAIYEPDGSDWTKIKRMRYAQQDNQGVIFPGNLIEITQSLPLRNVRNMDLRPLHWWTKSPVRLFNRLQELPVIECMAKMGFQQLVKDYVSGKEESDIGSPAKFLGIDKMALAAFANSDASKHEIELWRQLDPKNKEVELFGELKELCGGYFSYATKVATYGITIKKMVGYLKKQRIEFRTSHEMMEHWTDYLEMAEIIGLSPKTNKKAITPQHLKAEHNRLSDLIEISKNEIYEQALQKRVELLNKLSWSDKYFVIRPLQNTEEFINESRILDHCVKTYIKRCILAEANIFGLRKASEPDTPYYTVNISTDGKLIMNLGKHNREATSEVKKFTAKWLKQVERRLKQFSIENNAIETEENKIRIGA